MFRRDCLGAIFFISKILQIKNKLVIESIIWLLETRRGIVEIGKLPNELLEKILKNTIDNRREEVLVGSGIGEDNAILDLGDDLMVISTDPITGASKNLGRLAVNISCNDVAASGGEPIAILVTILAPEATSPGEIEGIMADISEVAGELDIEIAGGHTEVTDAVNRIVLTTTVIGKLKRSRMENKNKAQPGDRVLITKFAGIEGTSIIASEHRNFLRGKLKEEEIEEALDLASKLSVVKEGRLGGEAGVAYMHDITEGGVLGAVWEASKALKMGVKIYKDRIPVKPVTKKIGNIYDINIYRLISSGSMLMVTSEEKAKKLELDLAREGIELTDIGELTQGDRVLIQEGEDFLEVASPGADELYKALDFQITL